MLLLGLAGGPIACGGEGPDESQGSDEAPVTIDEVVGRWELLEHGGELEMIQLFRTGRFRARVFFADADDPVNFDGTYLLDAQNNLSLAAPGLGLSTYRAGRTADGDLTLRKIRPVSPGERALRYGRGAACPAGQRNVRGLAYNEYWSGGAVVAVPFTADDFASRQATIRSGTQRITGTIDRRGRITFPCVPEGPYWFDEFQQFYLRGGSAVFRMGEGISFIPFSEAFPPGWKMSPGVDIQVSGFAPGGGEYLSVAGFWGLEVPEGPDVAEPLYDPAAPRRPLIAAQYQPGQLAGAAKVWRAVRAGIRVVDFETVGASTTLNLGQPNPSNVYIDWDIRTQIERLAHGRPLVARIPSTPNAPGNGLGIGVTLQTSPRPQLGPWAPLVYFTADLSQNISGVLSYVDPAPLPWPRTLDVFGYAGVRLSNGKTGVLQIWDNYAPLVDGTIAPQAGQQVTNLRVNGRLTDRRLTGVGSGPLVSWSPPSGAATRHYVVYVTPFDETLDTGGAVITDATSVRLSPGHIPGPSYLTVGAVQCRDGGGAWCIRSRRTDEISDVLVP